MQAFHSDFMINVFWEKMYKNIPGRNKKDKVNSGRKRNIRWLTWGITHLVLHSSDNGNQATGTHDKHVIPIS